MIKEKDILKKKQSLKGKTLDELREYFISKSEPAYRAEQVFKWIYGN